MRLLDRYLLRELLVPLGYCLGGFLLFWVAFDLFAELGEFRRKGLTGGDIAAYYLVTTPEFLVVIMPMAFLLALLYTLTDLARHHELTAIRSAGISLWRTGLPYFTTGLLLSLGSFAVNELWVPGSAETAEAVLRQYQPPKPGTLARNKVRHLAFTNSRDGRFWQIGIYDVAREEMTKPQVFWAEPGDGRMALNADRAAYTNGTWAFFNATLYRTPLDTNALPVPLVQTNFLPMRSFSETPELIRSEIKVSNSMSLRRAKRATDLSINEILNYLRLHPQPAPADSAWLWTKLHGRIAAPWTCLVVVLIAVPFGAGSGRRNAFVGVASSIVLAFVYFVVQQLGLALGTGGYLAPWLAAWFPNLSFGLAGMWMTARVR